MAKYIDITGNRYNKLVAIKNVGSSKTYKCALWECSCDCGNTVIVPSSRLKNGDIKSCGCFRKEYQKKDLKNNREKNLINGTNVAIINSLKVNKNSKSGHKGVCRAKGKWYAYISIKKQTYSLGYFDKIEDAIKARREAEEKFFKPIIEKYIDKQN